MGTVTIEHDDGVTLARVDDRKANAYSPEVLDSLGDALDGVEADEAQRVLVIVGRDGVFSGGFELSIMRRVDRSTLALVTQGGELVRRLYASPKPVVAACTGHAIAAGAFVLLASHARVAARGEFRIGLVETQIGMPLPDWSVELTRARLTPRHFETATIESRMYDPDGAEAAGFVDTVVEPRDLEAAALEEARRLAALDAGAYATNAAKVRADALARIDACLATDRAQLDALGA